MNLLGLVQLKLARVEASRCRAASRENVVAVGGDFILFFLFILVFVFSADFHLSFVVVLLLLYRRRAALRPSLLLPNATTRSRLPFRRRRRVCLAHQLFFRLQQIFSLRSLLAFANLSILFRYFQRVQQNGPFRPRRVFFFRRRYRQQHRSRSSCLIDHLLKVFQLQKVLKTTTRLLELIFVSSIVIIFFFFFFDKKPAASVAAAEKRQRRFRIFQQLLVQFHSWIFSHRVPDELHGNLERNRVVVFFFFFLEKKIDKLFFILFARLQTFQRIFGIRRRGGERRRSGIFFFQLKKFLLFLLTFLLLFLSFLSSLFFFVVVAPVIIIICSIHVLLLLLLERRRRRSPRRHSSF